MTYEFTSTGKFEIEGRGTVYTVYAPHEYKRDECPFLNQVVMIDGHLFICFGVESYAVCPTRKGAGIGLLVKKDLNDEPR